MAQSRTPKGNTYFHFCPYEIRRNYAFCNLTIKLEMGWGSKIFPVAVPNGDLPGQLVCDCLKLFGSKPIKFKRVLSYIDLDSYHLRVTILKA